MAATPSEPPILDQLRALRIAPVEGHGLFYAMPAKLRDALIEQQERLTDDGK